MKNALSPLRQWVCTASLMLLAAPLSVTEPITEKEQKDVQYAVSALAKMALPM